jgi:type II secretory pathway pseudopilin PulG
MSSSTSAPRARPSAEAVAIERAIMRLKHKEGMQLAQGTSRGERGFAMAALLVALAIMSVVMSALLPVWRTLSIREKEEELIWRGRQYDRAIQLYRKKTSAPGPPSIDVLVKDRFLRRKYSDPITRGDFELVGVNPAAANAPGVQQPKIGFGQLIGGVRSKSNARSFRELDGKKTYAEWQFTYVPWRPGGQPALPGTEGPGGIRAPGQPQRQPQRPSSGSQTGSGFSRPRPFTSGSGPTTSQPEEP